MQPQHRATAAQIVGVTLGNALEFYDFLVFSFFAIQIGRCFFPKADPSSSLLAALATFGAGFLTRPLGALILGRYGDRAGRRPAMILSFAMIGASSLGVALVPPFAAIGVAAPLLVIALRLVQGFALGGEVGPSTAFLAEAAPRHRRGLYISLQFVGQMAAVLVAGLIGVTLAAVLNEAALAAWGWRVAMALGAAIVPVGLALRAGLPETLDADASLLRPPFTRYARVAAFAFFAMLAGTITTYVLNYLSTYAATVVKLPSGVAFGATVAVGAAGMIGALLGGWLYDRGAGRALITVPMALGASATLPGFWLVAHLPGAATLWTVAFALRLLFGIAMSVALIVVTLELPSRVRSGAIAITYALAISVFGGTTQFVIAWLTQVTGDPLAPAWYMLAAALIGVAATVVLRPKRA